MLTPLLIALACRPSQPAIAPADSGDVVLILIDSLRGDGVSYAGYPRQTTPHLDAIAAESAWFSRAHATSSWTLPAVASIFTGEWPWQHRAVTDLVTPGRYGIIPRRTETFVESLARHGYTAGAFVNHPHLAPTFGLDQGFVRYDCCGAQEPGPDQLGTRSAQETVEAALRWVDAVEGPAFLMVHLMDAHYGYDPAPECAGRFLGDEPPEIELPVPTEQFMSWWDGRARPTDPQAADVRAAYDEEVCSADAAVGALADGLRGMGRWDDARVAVTSTHGVAFWDHGAFGHGHGQMSALTHIPLLIKAPGVTQGENRTILDLTWLRAFLETGEGPLWELARSGRSESGGLAWSGAPRRTMEQVSVIGEARRLIVKVESSAAELWVVDPDGREVELSAAVWDRETVQALPSFDLLQRARPDPFTAAVPRRWARLDGIDGEALQRIREGEAP